MSLRETWAHSHKNQKFFLIKCEKETRESNRDSPKKHRTFPYSRKPIRTLIRHDICGCSGFIFTSSLSHFAASRRPRELLRWEERSEACKVIIRTRKSATKDLRAQREEWTKFLFFLPFPNRTYTHSILHINWCSSANESTNFSASFERSRFFLLFFFCWASWHRLHFIHFSPLSFASNVCSIFFLLLAVCMLSLPPLSRAQIDSQNPRE